MFVIIPCKIPRWVITNPKFPLIIVKAVSHFSRDLGKVRKGNTGRDEIMLSYRVDGQRKITVTSSLYHGTCSPEWNRMEDQEAGVQMWGEVGRIGAQRGSQVEKSWGGRRETSKSSLQTPHHG
jgi:hypothetical protein